MARPKTRFPDELLDEKFTNLHTLVHERYNATDKKLEENKLVVLEKLDEIKVETSKTNGSVATANIEIANIKQWQSYVIGFCACLSVFLVPLLIAMAINYIAG